MGHCRQHTLEVRQIGDKLGNNLAKDRKQKADFVGPAARQQTQHRHLSPEPQPIAQARTATHQLGPLDHRMADEGRLQSKPLEKRHLKRQQCEKVISNLAHGFGAPGTRGPHLRRDVFYDGHVRRALAETPGNPMGEIRRVDEQNRIGLPLGGAYAVLSSP